MYNIIKMLYRTCNVNSVLVSLTVVFSLLTLARSCTHVKNRASLPTLVHFSDVVAYGKVGQRLPDTKYGYGLPNLFAVEFHVYCTYKGGPIAGTVNITGAGHVPGTCHHTRLKVGNKYVVLLDYVNGDLEPTSRDIQVTNDTTLSLATVYRVCGLELHYPKDMQSTYPNVQCPAPEPAGECTPYVASPGRNATFPTAQPVVAENKQTTAESSAANIVSARSAMNIFCILTTFTLFRKL